MARRPVRSRHAVRALLLAPPGPRALLLRFRHPAGDGDLWLTPGGGVRAGERDLDALRREVWEETGLRIKEEPPLIWRREHLYPHDGGWTRQAEDIYLAWVAPFTPTAANNPEDDERAIFRGFRWWTTAEIRASDALVVPRDMASRIDDVVAGGPPSTPIVLDG